MWTLRPTFLLTLLGIGSLACATGLPEGVSPVRRAQELREFSQDHGGVDARKGIPIAYPFRLRIVEEETGSPTPAMIALRYAPEGTFAVPAEAADFFGHFDDGPQHRRLLPIFAPHWEPVGAHCVDGTATFYLIPGPWDLWVTKGIEYVPVHEEFETGEAPTPDRTVSLRRWVDMKTRGWWSGDGHVHSTLTNPFQRARLVRWARAMDTHVVNVLEMGDITATWFKQAGFGEAFRYQVGDTVLVPGQECPRTDEFGHMEAMNLSAGLVREPDRYYLYDAMTLGAHRQGALVAFCHVSDQTYQVDQGMSLFVPTGQVNLAEVLQFERLDPALWYVHLNLGWKLAALAGSDVPWGGSIGEVRTYALLGAEEFTADRWFEAARCGRTFVTNGPMIEFSVNGAPPGDEITVESGENLRVRARAWGHPTIGAPRTLEVVAHGRVLASATGVADSTQAIEIERELSSAHGLWIAARATCPNGEVAHTTPIYVNIESKGFEDRAELAANLAVRRTRLDEITVLVRTERESNPSGPIARMGDEILARVAIAREIYERLETGATDLSALRFR
ncbi:MAG: hypothetical protein GHCLOJNM_02605 [bacterium]|nr:hypothetical protein [bacterium]